MRQSQYFLKTSKTKPADDVSVNARLLEQGGFVQKVMAGVYSYLPLGWRVLNKIEDIVREEMDAIGADEILMPALHPKASWEKTGRWKDLDVLFKIKSVHGYEYALGPTHEEIVTPMALPVINSYKDLPKAVYQIQTKFRDEPRAKSGLLRGREFRMKDLYSYHSGEKDLEKYYTETVIPAYKKIFSRLGLSSILTEATGGTFSKFSHEFQEEIENGEDTIYVCENCGMAKNKEIFKEGADCTNCGKTTWRETKASEVGNIFKLMNKFSGSFNLKFMGDDGKQQDVLMGCYGIGTSRLMGVIAEKFNDEKGILWPENVAPFKVHLLALSGAEKRAEDIYQSLQKAGVEALYDDRDVSAGTKFADSDLIGIPYRVLVSEKSLKKEMAELKKRSEDKHRLVEISSLLESIK
ncbi:MAG: prolyl-tRNA synthetase [Candidatus Doudnabacteria bacterium CG10_big_fil_rev_8_21_14_0_10_42_18]|uniref:Proline--tRNA ligase n=1 Tax=Candidatus Doudnabacteria bacterium CG10_big_fil_rev_8_21_14_0_10_42_18 TaxID=1974552 RepID=A0A2H0VC31_9BACT|nr:MAG: prolyl-tRNA synthetase [Candidatus Doudnabacteria bacterium CG10_big_fil_rev_8_21_14_0_10_42_18]